MAAYACTITKIYPRAFKVFKPLKFMVGKADITNYNSTKVKVTDITNQFDTLLAVVVDGVSDNGYLVKWDATAKAFKAFTPVNVIASAGEAGTDNTLMKSASATLEVSGSGTAFQVPAAEVADDVDVGEVSFIAIGLV